MKQSAVADWADQHKVKIVKPLNSLDLKGQIEDLDCVITIGYGVLLPQAILELPKFGFINLHFSLLPLYRGADQLEQGMDTGPIYSQSSVDIDPSWRSSELLASLSQQGPIVLQEALLKISQGISPVAQSGQSSLAPKISKEEARLDFSVHAKDVVNAVRAFTYEPGAWTLWKEEPFKITSAVLANNADIPMGAVITSEKSVYVGCADQSAIELVTVVPAGKKEMKAIDWARGARLVGGEFFG
ncbi:MAG: hypothetical protein RL568_162 [Actinomycetota bacterium]